MLDFAPSKYKKEMLKTLATLIKIPSVKNDPGPNMPYGKDVFDALMYMLDQAERMDLESVNLFGRAGYVVYGTGEENLAIIVHLDVVPAGDGWHTPPFEATEKEGRVYGRGAVDNKGPAVAALYALYALKESCISLNKGVRLIFGCDEESGWDDIDYYLKNYPEPEMVVSPDASFPIINAEKGLVHFTLTKKTRRSDAPLSIRELSGGTRANIVPNNASCVLQAPYEIIEEAVKHFGEDIPAGIKAEKKENGVRIEVTGKAAHGSTPAEGVNAIAYLIAFLNTLPLALGEVENFVYTMAELVGTQIDGTNLGIRMKDEKFGELTVNLGTIKLTEEGISATLDIRYPVGADGKLIIETVKQRFAAYGIGAEAPHAMDSHYVPEDSPLVLSLKEVYQNCFEKEAECLCSSGATYARAFKNGVAFGPIAHDAPQTEHGPDEYIEVDDLVKLSEVLACTMIKICGGETLC